MSSSLRIKGDAGIVSKAQTLKTVNEMQEGEKVKNWKKSALFFSYLYSLTEY